MADGYIPCITSFYAVAEPTAAGRIENTGGGWWDYDIGMGYSDTYVAIANPGWKFKEWTGVNHSKGNAYLSQSGNTANVLYFNALDSSEQGTFDLIAHFERDELTVTTTVGSPRGTTSGDGTYNTGEQYTVVATPYNEYGEIVGDKRYEFDHWDMLNSQGTIISRIDSKFYTGTMGTESLTFVAYFREQQTRRKIYYDVKYYKEQFLWAELETTGERKTSPSGEFETLDPSRAVITIACRADDPQNQGYVFSLQNVTSTDGEITWDGSTATVTISDQKETGNVDINAIIWHQHDGKIMCDKDGALIYKDEGILCR